MIVLCIFKKKLAKALINNSYTNEKTYVCPEKTRKIKTSHIFVTAPTYATEYYEKEWLA